MATKRMVVYGGRGALGSACVNHFKSANWWVANIDLDSYHKADFNITVPKEASWVQQEDCVVNALDVALGGKKLNAVICVGGGWASGNANYYLSRQADVAWRHSVWPSTIAATVASQHLSPGGVLALTGDNAAQEGTIGYGMAKAAIHELIKSLGTKDSGLPESSLAVGILPLTLNTETNQKWMPEADFSCWTPVNFVTDLFEKWIKGDERPPTGSLVSIITMDKM